MGYIFQLFFNTFIFMLLLVAPFIIILLISFFITYSRYRNTEYYSGTKNGLFQTLFDKGRYGEYLTYKKLVSLQGTKRFLFNCYIPKEDGSTTEIDIIMIHTSGIYVFESKNFSGWIFGTETQKYWSQSLPRGRRAQKIKFYNPIMQNQSHISALIDFLPSETQYTYHSLIVFSERCSLKKINLTSHSHHVIKRNEVLNRVLFLAQTQQSLLSDTQIEQLYQILFPYSQADNLIKTQHIENIEKTKNEYPAPVSVPLPNPDPLCSKCGSKMIKRTAAKGERAGKEFWGCENFPKCRFVLNIENEQEIIPDSLQG